MKKGSILIGILLLLVGLLTVGIALNTAVMATTVKISRSYRTISAQAYAEAGIQKALWELNKAGSSYTGESNTTSIAGGAFDVNITNVSSNVKQITATGYVPNKEHYLAKRIIRAKITDKPSSTGVAFNYGVQAGALGITMSNNAVINGNVYSQGTLSGQNNSRVTGDVIMSGVTGRISGGQISGNAKAHTINNVRITKDAYYQAISGSTVGGVSHPNSPDPATISLPLSDSTISQWEIAAVAGGTHTGDYVINGTSMTLGPKKIDGNLIVTNGAVLTMTGTIWVTGNITFSNNAIIKLVADYGTSSGLIIADNPGNRSNSGKINVSNNVQILGSGNSKSYIMMLSTNQGNTVSNPAIVAGNNSTAVIYYTTTGMLEIANNANLRAITGGGLHLSNGAQITYDTGLASTEFSGGPGGAWGIIEWQVLY
jgi:Tfp pilus assembly protein PilV